MVLSASTPENSVWMCLFSVSMSLVLRSSTSESLSLRKLRSLLKSFPDPSNSPRILVGSPMWMVKLEVMRFPRRSMFLETSEFPLMAPLFWSSTSDFWSCWTVWVSDWNWASLSLKAAPLISAKALAFSISSLAYLMALAMANLSPRTVWSMSSWSVVHLPPFFVNLAMAVSTYFLRLDWKSPESPTLALSKSSVKKISPISSSRPSLMLGFSFLRRLISMISFSTNNDMASSFLMLLTGTRTPFETSFSTTFSLSTGTTLWAAASLSNSSKNLSMISMIPLSPGWLILSCLNSTNKSSSCFLAFP